MVLFNHKLGLFRLTIIVSYKQNGGVIMYENLSLVQPVILAGGESSRMGYNKAFARFIDSTLIETIYTMLNFTFELPPIIVTNDKAPFEKLSTLKDAVILEDEYGHSTLGAVRTAFAHSDAENLFVVGCDMPFISLEVASRMMDYQGKCLAVVPILNGSDICMHAIYNRSLVPIMDKKLAAGESLLHSFYQEIPLLQLPLEEGEKEASIFIDISTPADLRYAESKFQEWGSA